jgi:hypothetical protein
VELLDRYLQTVKFWLPKAQKADIVAELSDDIRSQIEAREAALRRRLSEAELEAMLDRCGSPILVAQRYLPSKYLIGPALFPVYRLTLTIVSCCFLVPWLLVWASLVAFSPDYRAANPGLGQLHNLLAWWLLVVHTFVAVTALFAIVERYQVTPRFLHAWKARKVLPHDLNHIPRSQSLGELAGGVVFILWWLDVLRLPPIPGIDIALAPIWRDLYWPILLVDAATVAVAAMNVFRPWWTPRRSALRLGIDISGFALACALLAAGRWVVISISNVPPDRIHAVEQWADVPVLVTLVVTAIIFLLKGVQDTRRARRKQPIRSWAMTALGAD